MKKILRYIAILFSVLLVLLLGLVGYLVFFLPDTPPLEDTKVEVTPERVERGKYLANHVMLCVDCHSKRDWGKFSAPLVGGTEGEGGEVFNQKMGFPGTFYATNITPSGIGNWSDAEIFRAITSGISKDGRALFPLMPYKNFGQLEREDIYDIIAYLRTLESKDGSYPEPDFDFPMNLIINTLPTKPDFRLKKNENRNEYFTVAAGCFDCHTKQESGEFTGAPFAGGMEFKQEDGSIIRSVNITFDKETGIGNWTKKDFIDRFKHFEPDASKNIKVNHGELQTIMPWTMYAGMTDEDLGAIYDYLKTIPAVRNKVEPFTSAPD
ncbi:MAG: hypothetical protein OZ913_00160 [Ignavibacteriaceae bacterium]|nr:hypothetical protein [Ignavibacteriaceae bacterium]